MDDFAVIYRILSALQKQMDYDEPNPDVVSADTLNITQNRLDNIWALLAKEEYVSGVMVRSFDTTRAVHLVCPRITLKGLEYLAESPITTIGDDKHGCQDTHCHQRRV